MPVTPDQPGPYAPTSAILEIVTRHRNKGLPSPVNSEVLGRAGISDSLIPRTLQALQTLDLIDEDGKPTQVLEGIRLAPEAEYQTRLKEWLTSAYADALQYIEPETATETDIRDAFRSYKPVGQQSRMVSLFSGLFRAAGVGPDKPLPTTRKSQGGSPAPKSRAPAAKTRTGRNKPAAGADKPSINTDGLPPALAGLLASLPKQGQRWTEDEHDAFVNTFQAVLTYCYP
ncbi:MAG: DUF5343 domain-containing protein, partial [Parvularculaceae bacterium]